MNDKFIEEIEKHKNSVNPADYANSIKLLKKFRNIPFNVFWNNSVAEYFPAVDSGLMKISELDISHEDGLILAKELANQCNEEELSNAFLYGIANVDLKYCVALPAYYYVKNMKVHNLLNSEAYYEKNQFCWQICGLHSSSKEKKMQFYWINHTMAFLYLSGGFCPNVNDAITVLQEYKKMRKVDFCGEGYEKLITILQTADNIEKEKKVGTLVKTLKSLAIMKDFTREMIVSFVENLGYLNILHSDNEFGYYKTVLPKYKERDPDEYKNDYGYPVRFWKGKNGVDWDTFDFIFHSEKK